MPEGDEPTVPADRTGVAGNVVAAESAVLAARRYQPLDELARGGVGRIVRARDLAFDRMVAIKEPLEPLAGGERLRAEAAILATLQHPSIVQVYDAGTRVDGVPFFAMQLIEGRSLRDVIRDAPSLEQRLALLPQVVAVAEAMAYAHAQGVIHRDLKPANVLVGQFGETIVIDWGLAKVLGGGEVTVDGRRTPRPPAGPTVATTTTTGDVMGTPAYMAPEQARGERVDARADVYALGAILYHVLAGVAPFTGQGDRDILEIVLDTAPTPIAELQPRVPADLDAIVTKAMARDPAARYASAAGFADDLVRFQTGRLVSARRYSPIARSRRWLGRHRAVVAALGLAAASATAVLILRPAAGRAPAAGVTCSLADQRTRADAAWSRGPRAEAVRAAFAASGRATAADTFERVAGRLDVYTDAWARARVDVCTATHVRGEQSEALLDLRMSCLDRRLTAVSALVDVLAAGSSADVVDNAADATARLPSLTGCADAAALQAAMAPPADPATRARVDAVRADLARATALEKTGQYVPGLEIARQATTAAAALGYPPVHAEAMTKRGDLEKLNGKFADAEATFNAVLPIAADAHDDRMIAELWAELIYVVGYQLGRTDDGLRLRPVAETAVRRAGSAPELVARVSTYTAMVLLSQGKYAEARPLIERSLATLEQLLGPQDPRVAATLAPLAWVASVEGDYEAAARLQQRALAINEAVLGPEHPVVALALNNLAESWRALDKLDDARAAHRRAIAIREKVLGPEHPSVATSLHNLAIVEAIEHRDLALPLFERALAIREKALGPDHPDVADSLVGRGTIYKVQGSYEAARRDFQRALAIQEKALGAEHPQLAYAVLNLGEVAELQGAHEEARRDFARALALGERGRGPGHPELAYYLTGLATALVGLGRPREAVAAAERALAIREKPAAPGPLLARTRFVLARALWATPPARRRARDLATQARDGYAAEPDAGKQAEVDDWLKAR